MATSFNSANESNNRSKRSTFLVHGYVREFSKLLAKESLIPEDIVSICWKFFFIPFASAIITQDKDLDTFFDLMSEKLSIERINNAKLLYRATRETQEYEETKTKTQPHVPPFPYDKLRDKGPYLFIIQAKDGNVFGGYSKTNIIKTKACSYMNDVDAFVFVLKGAKKQKPALYPIKRGGKDATFWDGYGYFWLFGPSGADVLIYPPKWDKVSRKITTINNNYSKSFCCRNGNGQLKYEIPLRRSLVGTSTQYEFDTAELEIYHV